VLKSVGSWGFAPDPNGKLMLPIPAPCEREAPSAWDNTREAGK